MTELFELLGLKFLLQIFPIPSFMAKSTISVCKDPHVVN